ncbi:NIPSNAP family protein [Pseudonocardia sp. GCM10023141]|uniref:NIPSNAP family protein n=1 Tax=Pseudonocardia sp. GCM10023141 TaxID=3252653 RepID=UPI0036167081
MSIVELRQYTLRPGRRDDLVTLFEREFVEAQEEAGIRVIGTFRDVGDPDRFVWIRGFADMATRLAGLTEFYGGPVWKEHRDAANATMIDSDDVLLLAPVDGEFCVAERTDGAGEPGRVLAVVHLDRAPDPAAAAARLGAPLVVLRTAAAVNDFPALPVRPEPAEVWFARFPDAAALRAARAALEVPDAAQVLVLEPTARSAYR